MPSAYLKTLVDKYDVSMKTLEKYWKESKSAAKETYDEEDAKFWGTVTIIFKNKINKHLGMDESIILTFKEYTIKESLEDELAKKVIDKVSKQIADTLDDELINTFKDRLMKKIELEMNDVDSGSEEGDEGDEMDTEEGSEETDGNGEEDPEIDPEEDAEGEEIDPDAVPKEPEETEAEKLEKTLTRENKFISKIAKDHDIDLQELLDLWEKSKKECKVDEKHNQYWTRVDKIYRRNIEDTYNVEL